jgi:hypothetical protein
MCFGNKPKPPRPVPPPTPAPPPPAAPPRPTPPPTPPAIPTDGAATGNFAKIQTKQSERASLGVGRRRNSLRRDRSPKVNTGTSNTGNQSINTGTAT